MDQNEINRLAQLDIPNGITALIFRILYRFWFMLANRLGRPHYKWALQDIVADLMMRVPENGCGCLSSGNGKCNTNQCLNRRSGISCPPNCGKDCRNQPFLGELSTLFRILPFPGRGYGLTALLEYKRGDLILEFVGTFRHKHELTVNQVSSCVRIFDSDYFLENYEAGNYSHYINHSCDSNAFLKVSVVDMKIRVGVYAKRDTISGEEITRDYGKISFVCACASYNCCSRGFGETPQQPSSRLPRPTNVPAIMERPVTAPPCNPPPPQSMTSQDAASQPIDLSKRTKHGVGISAQQPCVTTRMGILNRPHSRGMYRPRSRLINAPYVIETETGVTIGGMPVGRIVPNQTLPDETCTCETIMLDLLGNLKTVRTDVDCPVHPRRQANHEGPCVQRSTGFEITPVQPHEQPEQLQFHQMQFQMQQLQYLTPQQMQQPQYLTPQQMQQPQYLTPQQMQQPQYLTPQQMQLQMQQPLYPPPQQIHQNIQPEQMQLQMQQLTFSTPQQRVQTPATALQQGAQHFFNMPSISPATYAQPSLPATDNEAALMPPPRSTTTPRSARRTPSRSSNSRQSNESPLQYQYAGGGRPSPSNDTMWQGADDGYINSSSSQSTPENRSQLPPNIYKDTNQNPLKPPKKLPMKPRLVSSTSAIPSKSQPVFPDANITDRRRLPKKEGPPIKPQALTRENLQKAALQQQGNVSQDNENFQVGPPSQSNRSKRTRESSETGSASVTSSAPSPGTLTKRIKQKETLIKHLQKIIEDVKGENVDGGCEDIEAQLPNQEGLVPSAAVVPQFPMNDGQQPSSSRPQRSTVNKNPKYVFSTDDEGASSGFNTTPEPMKKMNKPYPPNAPKRRIQKQNSQALIPQERRQSTRSRPSRSAIRDRNVCQRGQVGEEAAQATAFDVTRHPLYLPPLEGVGIAESHDLSLSDLSSFDCGTREQLFSPVRIARPAPESSNRPGTYDCRNIGCGGFFPSMQMRDDHEATACTLRTPETMENAQQDDDNNDNNEDERNLDFY